MGACPPPLRGRSAVVARNAACTSGEPKIDSHVDFDLTAAWRHHVSMLPSSRSQSAATTALAGGTCELFRVKQLREIADWWILGRCLPPIAVSGHAILRRQGKRGRGALPQTTVFAGCAPKHTSAAPQKKKLRPRGSILKCQKKE